MNDLLNQLLALVGPNLLNLLSALGILIVGWIVARLIAWGIYRLLKRTNLDNKLAGAMAAEEEAGDETPSSDFVESLHIGIGYLGPQHKSSQ